MTKNWFLGMLITALFLFFYLIRFSPVQVLDFAVYDLFMSASSDGDESSIVVVAVDERSARDIGGLPVPRVQLAEMVKRLTQYGARKIGIYLPLSNRTSGEGLAEIRELRKGLEKDRGGLKNRTVSRVHLSLRQLENRLDQDARLAAAVRSSGKVLLPLVLSPNNPAEQPDESSRRPASGISFLPEEESGHRKGLDAVTGFIDRFRSRHLPAADITPPYAEAARTAGSLGFMNLYPERDNVVRSIPLVVPLGDTYYPSFSLQLSLGLMGGSKKSLRYEERERGERGIVAGERLIPTGRDLSMLIDYGPPGFTVPHVSFSDVMNGSVPAKTFKGKAAIIGVTSPYAARRYGTPAGGPFPDVDIAAIAAHNIVSGRHIARPAWASLLELGALLYFGLFASLVIPLTRRWVGAVIVGFFLLAWLGIAAFLFFEFGYAVDAASPVMPGIAGYALVAARKFAAERAGGTGAAEHIESNKMLGLSFQSQGLLDMAFEKFIKCPLQDDSIKSLLYNLGLDFERKRMFNKAVSVYEHILRERPYKDIADRIERLKSASGTAMPAGPASSDDRTMVLNGGDIRPTLGRYEIVNEIGRGAMGTVYLGKDPRINRDVAIKTLKYDEMSEQDLREFKERFFREAEAAGTLSHQNIVIIHDVGEEHDMAYIAMELLRGEDLASLLKREGSLPPDEALEIVSAVASALAYAHSRGIVHRDIKPANIMRLENGTIKVTDFGIARIMDTQGAETRTGDSYGTPSYMSPEQAAGKKVEGASDLFSLGCVMYELISGEKPFRGETIAEVMRNIRKGEYAPINTVVSGVPRCCVRISERLLQKSARKRYRSGQELVEDITKCIEKQGG